MFMTKLSPIFVTSDPNVLSDGGWHLAMHVSAKTGLFLPDALMESNQVGAYG